MNAATATAPVRVPIVTRPLVLMLVAELGALTSFYLLLSVVPMVVGGVAGAGAATATLMLATVAAEPVTPRLVARFGYRAVIAGALLLLGLPALALLAGTSTTTVLVVCALRGVGFGVMMVAGGALAAELVPAGRRGEGLGLYGAAVGLPGVVGLPAGVWLAAHAGFAVVFVAATLTALAGLAVLRALPARSADPGKPAGIAAGLRRGALVRPALAFGATAMAAGIVVAFLPLAVTGSATVTVALLAQSVTATAARWLAGRHSDRHSDRHGPAALLVPGLIVATAGMLTLVVTTDPAAVVAGMALFGTGFGITQNASLATMLGQVSPAGFGMVNAIWSLAYDGGMGLGAAGFGALATWTGLTAALAVTSLIMLAALRPARTAARARLGA
ncbi:MAG TPA: MFS transporter [Actinophytocola sp.]|jgi:predicted MFS family arabinose efflux permease|nr:MFS transporter [Actinophytocola sp.]